VHDVFVTIDCAQTDQDHLTTLAKATLAVFASQPGFASTSLYRSLDGTQLVTHLVFDTKADSDACMVSPDFAASEAVRDFSALVQGGRATMVPRDFAVVARISRPG
jgi:heme-degrading monooxygenase HmoA